MARALVARRVVVEILLMICFSGPPLSSRRKFRHDLALPPLLVGQLRDLTGNLLLLVVVVVNGGAVLWAGVGTLLIESCGIMGAVEEF